MQAVTARHGVPHELLENAGTDPYNVYKVTPTVHLASLVKCHAMQYEFKPRAVQPSK
jgi:hypothetical protein